MGEFEFIESIRRSFEGIGDGEIVGIGDDCAVMQSIDGESIVVTTDMLVEGVHFLLEGGSARELGAKALAVNLSDVAAMGARPVASFLSIALPARCRGEWADEFMEGYRQMSEHHGVKLAGGDTTGSISGLAINVTAIGRAQTERLKFRSAARVGDIIAVNGQLGESAAGLRDILAGRTDTALAAIHRSPTPQVAEGQWLGQRNEVHAMMDLSDGLASDLTHILRASRVGAEVDLEAIPTPVDLQSAVAGGEDYKLLLTVASESFIGLARAYEAHFGAPLYPIGRIVEAQIQKIVEAPNKIIWLENGTPTERDWRGFVHF